jgi:HNH endonuclease
MGDTLRWFDEGAENLRLVLGRLGWSDQIPSGEDCYACPICLRVYSRADAGALTIEHVPPHALGGHPMLLTCTRCNNIAGHYFDADANQKAIADAFVRGTATGKAVKTTAYIDGIPMRGDARSTDDGIIIEGVPKQNSPREYAAFMGLLQSLTESGGDAAGRISFTIHTRFDEARARFSLIRAAYLAAFAGLGWSYILRPVMQSVRDQLMNPEARTLDSYIFRDPDSPTSARRLLLVEEPDELRCVAVNIGEYSVFLPDWHRPMTWGETSEAFCRMSDAGGSLSLSLQGKEIPWPRSPVYFLDG